MKHKLLLSALTAIIFLAATTVADAGIFGRLSVVWNGCNPCLPASCMPCEPVVCNPCVPVLCDPCAPAFCDPCGPFLGRPVFRPFGGFFANLGARMTAVHCGPICDPCVPVAVMCDPCAPVMCDPCAPACGPFLGRPVFRPFGGFFANLGAKITAVHCGPMHCGPICDPCVPVAVMCDPCAPVTCDPCAPRRLRW